MTEETIQLKCSREAMSGKRIKKNILVMCVGAFTLFTAYDGPTMLQSTMNREVGVAALAINYACFCISALLFPKYFIKRYGSKATFVLSMTLYIPYIASNYYPHWVVMIPVSVLIGFSAALLWSSQATYLNDASVMLSRLSILKKEAHLKNDIIHSGQLRRDPCNQAVKNATPTEIETGCKKSLGEKSKPRKKNTSHAVPGPKISHADIKEVNNKNDSLTDLGSSTKTNSHHYLEVGVNLQTEPSETNDKNRFNELPETNDWNIYGQEDKNSDQVDTISRKNAADLLSGHRNFGVETTAPPSETNKLDLLGTKHPLAAEKNASLQVTDGIALDNVQNLSECRSSDRHEFAENHRRFSNACDKECGVRTPSDKSMRNDNKKTIVNRSVNTSGVEHADSTIEPRTSKSEEPCSKTKVESITARVFGIHGMAFLLSHVSGNLLAHFILKRGVEEAQPVNSTCACGAHYCNNANCLTNNLEGVPDQIRMTLTTVCVSLAVVSVLIVALLLEPLETKSEKASSISLEFLMATYEITKRTDLILLIPYTLYLGQIQGFFTGEFNKAYVSCAWGTHHVSLVSMTYGLFCAVFATSSGWIVKFLGRRTLFTFAALLNVAFCVSLLLWEPLRPEVLFTCAGMIGAFVGMTWSQLRAFYGVLFKEEEEAAFGAFYVWYSVGFCLSFACSTHFCTPIKICVLLVVSSIGHVGYFITEKRFK